MDQAEANLLQDQSSRQKRKQFFIIFLIIFFTLIICAIISVFTVLKHHDESRSLSANPTAAIRAACGVTMYYRSCIRSLQSSLLNRHKIHASDVFRLSIRAAFLKLLVVNRLPQTLSSQIKNENIIIPVLTDCQNLLNDSLDLLNRSLIMITRNDHVGLDEKILDFDDGVMRDLRNLMDQATKNVDRCLIGLHAGNGTTRQEAVKIKDVRERIQQAEVYMSLSLDILEKRDSIREIFDPSLQSILASFMLTRENYVLSIAVFCSQYLFLIFLFCSLLRVFRRRTRKIMLIFFLFVLEILEFWYWIYAYLSYNDFLVL